jgi:acid stress-induced BolA-like protein IbaG/YrbA
MMPVEEVRKMVEQALPEARVTVRDLTGTSDHFQVEVVSEKFCGKMLIEQHRMVQAPLAAAITDDRIHALTIKTYTPEEWKKKDLVNLT